MRSPSECDGRKPETVAASGAAIVGSFEAPLRKGDGRETMRVELDIETQRYRFPPEGACSHPEG